MSQPQDIKDRIQSAMFCGMTMSLRDDLCEMLDECWHELAVKDAEIARYKRMVSGMAPLSSDGAYVFVDGAGLVPIDHDRTTEPQQIDTAPKDGTMVLAVNADPAAQNPTVIYFDHGSVAFGIEGNWRTSTHERISLAAFTHWAPLPLLADKKGGDE